MKIALYSRHLKDAHTVLLQEFFDLLEGEDIEVCVFKPYMDELNEVLQLGLNNSFENYHSLPDDIDFMISIGGDGTLLDTVRIEFLLGRWADRGNTYRIDSLFPFMRWSDRLPNNRELCADTRCTAQSECEAHGHSRQHGTFVRNKEPVRALPLHTGFPTQKDRQNLPDRCSQRGLRLQSY